MIFFQGSGWQQVATSLQDFSQYSSRSYQSSLLGCSQFFQWFLFPPILMVFRDLSKRTKNNWDDHHTHVPQFSVSFLTRWRYSLIVSLSFIFILWCTGTAKSTGRQFFLVNQYEVWASGRDYVINLHFKPLICLCVLFSQMDSVFCTYHLVVGSDYSFLHNSLSITFSAQSFLLLFSFCTNFLYSSICDYPFNLSPDYLHLLFGRVLLISL